MTDNELILSGRAEELRLAFDQSFADPIPTDSSETVDFISLRLARDPHAIRMAEIAGLFIDVKISPCPSPLAELRGIAGFRGTLTPIYDLAALLGYPISSGRWLALAKGAALALTFDAFDGYFRVEPVAVGAYQRSASAAHVRELVRRADSAWPVIDIPSVITAIKARAAVAASSQKEH